MTKKIPDRIGTQGWSQFLESKQEMLAPYRRAQKKSKAHSVQVHHGNVAEAQFRKWLARFLPQKYGVTSGYVISQGANDSEKIPHFDVIVYDQLVSPVLWYEGSPDNSEAGTSRAIPAEYVVGVFEVKSSFEPSTVAEAVTKLQELEPLLSKIDEPNEKYKKFLPTNFCCALIFFELRAKNKDKEASLKNILEHQMRGFLGAIILGGENLSAGKTGRIKFLIGETPITTTIGADKQDLFGGVVLYGNPEPLEDNKYLGVMINWSEVEFAHFMFDLIAIWNETYDRRISTLHGLSYLNPERNKE